MASDGVVPIASFDNGAATLIFTYDLLTMTVTAAVATVLQGALVISLERKNGQTRTFTCTLGVRTVTTIPGNIKVTIDAETGDPMITVRGGNIIYTIEYDPTG